MPDHHNKAVFFDRDGTLIREVGYLSDPDEIEVLPGAFEAVRRANAGGALAIIITNQSGIARGLFSETDLRAIHLRLRDLFAEQQARVDAFFFCPHHPEGVVAELSGECGCRKPAPGLLERARDTLDVDLAASVIVGDKLIDVETGRRAGTRGVLVRSGYGEQSEMLLGTDLGEDYAPPDFIADTVLEAVDWFLEGE